MHPDHQTRLSRLAATFLLGGAVSATARAADAPAGSTAELKQQIEALQQRVRTIEAEQKNATDPAADVLRDAARRNVPVYAASTGLTAGYDKGFFLRSDDGNFLLKPSLHFQFRHASNLEQDAGGDADNFESGFEARRTRFRFDGNAFSPKFAYSFVWDTNRAGGAVSLLDAWGQYAFAEKWAIKFGQFKESIFHERDVSGFSQLAVDRSLTDALLGGTLTDRVQGVSLIHGGTKNDHLRAELAIHDGANSRNTNFQDGALHWGSGLRGEYKVFGDWASYKDLTAKNSKENLLVVGAGAEYTDRDGANVLLATVDAQYEAADRVAVYGAFHGAYTDPHGGTATTSRFDWGALGQIGYLLNKKWEVFGRYDIVVVDEDFAAGEDTFQEITAGVNYYLGPDGSYLHRAKVQLDASYLPIGAPLDQTQAGIIEGDGDQFVLRAQLQLQI